MKTRTLARLDRERKTIETMIALWCKGTHGRKLTDCPDCSGLFAYALNRIARCPFQEDKPTCAQCTVHCYHKTRRQEIRSVMRYAGPRMLVFHPILTFRHYFDEWTFSEKEKT